MSTFVLSIVESQRPVRSRETGPDATMADAGSVRHVRGITSSVCPDGPGLGVPAGWERKRPTSQCSIVMVLEMEGYQRELPVDTFG
jgi:hypothetical protein